MKIVCVCDAGVTPKLDGLYEGNSRLSGGTCYG